MIISYSYGILDLFHYGHLIALKKAKEGCDLHVVGLLSDSASRSWVGNIVSSEAERRAVLESISCVDWVMPQENLDPTDNLKKLHFIFPEAEITLFRGDGITVISAKEYLTSIGGKVQTLDYYDRLSPMEILKALNSRTENISNNLHSFSTKADTLFLLRDKVTKSVIEDILIITGGDYYNDARKCAERVAGIFRGDKVVVRSSSIGEDGLESSNAGHYESILGVDSKDGESVTNAIEAVLDSYKIDFRDKAALASEQVLIQKQTEEVDRSGVIFTRDIQKNRPYYVINYDDSGATDTVTSGQAGKTIYVAADVDENEIPAKWVSLINAVREIESILSKVLLDIEFAIKKDGSVVIFQARPLVASYKFGRTDATGEILKLKNKYKDDYKKFILQSGNHILSNMAFWNPAEIIGEHPHNLDYSLYQYIITHSSWNEGLVPMGYTTVAHDLMHRFGGRPYICVERAFQSLMPNDLNSDIKSALLEYYIDRIEKDISAHDKIEFEIVFSCYYKGIEQDLIELLNYGFSRNQINEIELSLKELTAKAIKHYNKVLLEDNEALIKLENKRKLVEKEVENRDITNACLINGMIALLDYIKEYGTPQFSRQARYAFIAKRICQSLVECGVWNKEEYRCFQGSINTIASKFNSDYIKLMNGEISEEQFKELYGHLRAGTYDITMPAYRSMSFFAVNNDEIKRGSIGLNSTNEEENRYKDDYNLGSKKLDQIWEKLNITEDEFIVFAKMAIEQREYFKYEFTKSLSLTLEIIAILAGRLGFTREEISHFGIEEIMGLSFYGSDWEMRERMEEMLTERKKEFERCEKLIMPPVVIDASDFDFIMPQGVRPNFITSKKITSKLAKIGNSQDVDIIDRIVVIENADPGYDWIFTKGISGLITKYGGVASHMAIRCAEFDIPAAIGCGTQIFEYVNQSKAVTLDCENGIIVRQ